MDSPSQETEVTSTSTRPVDNVVIATNGLQDRNINILAGTTMENKGKLILIVDSVDINFTVDKLIRLKYILKKPTTNKL